MVGEVQVLPTDSYQSIFQRRALHSISLPRQQYTVEIIL